jgi:hypothetical protein
VKCQALCHVVSAGSYVNGRSTYQRATVGYATKPKHKPSVRAAHVLFISPKINFLFSSEKLLTEESVSGSALSGTTDAPLPSPPRLSGSCDQHIMIRGRVDAG